MTGWKRSSSFGNSMQGHRWASTADRLFGDCHTQPGGAEGQPRCDCDDESSPSEPQHRGNDQCENGKERDAAEHGYPTSVLYELSGPVMDEEVQVRSIFAGEAVVLGHVFGHTGEGDHGRSQYTQSDDECSHASNREAQPVVEVLCAIPPALRD